MAESEGGLVCPACATRFAHDRVECPSFGVEAEESDGRLVGNVCPPEDAYLATCPRCGYTALADLWDAELPAETARAIARGALRAVAPDPTLPSARYSLAAHCAALRGDHPFLRGYLHLRGSWAARAEGNPEAEGAHQEAAIDALEGALDSGDLDEDDAAVARYLLGELNRRLACFSAAVQHFDALLATAPESAPAQRAAELRQAALREDAGPVVWRWEDPAEREAGAGE